VPFNRPPIRAARRDARAWLVGFCRLFSVPGDGGDGAGLLVQQDPVRALVMEVEDLVHRPRRGIGGRAPICPGCWTLSKSVTSYWWFALAVVADFCAGRFLVVTSSRHPTQATPSASPPPTLEAPFRLACRAFAPPSPLLPEGWRPGQGAKTMTVPTPYVGYPWVTSLVLNLAIEQPVLPANTLPMASQRRPHPRGRSSQIPDRHGGQQEGRPAERELLPRRLRHRIHE